MKLFSTKSFSRYRNLIVSLLIFLIIGSCFYTGVSFLGKSSNEKEQEYLERAIHQNIAKCYALEGHYPESLSYLEDRYGITYNKNTYSIHYQIQGSNLFPKVTITKRQEGGNEIIKD